MAGKPRANWKIMSYGESIQAFPELREEIEEDRSYISCQFNDKNEAYCLHCGNTVRLQDMKVGVFVFTKTGFPVPEEDDRYWEGRVLTFCPTDGCDGGVMDWKDTPWCTSKDYGEWIKEQEDKVN